MYDIDANPINANWARFLSWSRENDFTKSDWDESKVERDENGRFASGGGGDSSGSSIASAPMGMVNYNTSPRPGMGDIGVTAGFVKDFINEGGPNGSSAKPHLVQHPDGSVTFTPERQALHDDIIEKFLATAEPEDGQPTMVMLGGGAASGKSSIEKNEELATSAGMLDARELGKGSGEALLVNPDLMKELLPEYDELRLAKDGNAANFVHEESSYLAKRLTDAGFETGRSIVLDGVNDGSAEKVIDKIETARDNGYKVVGVYVTADQQNALPRAIDRAERTGRAVELNAFYGGHAGVSQIFPEIATKFDKITLVDTNGNGPENAVVIGSGSGGQFNVANQALYERFLAKADYTPPPIERNK